MVYSADSKLNVPERSRSKSVHLLAELRTRLSGMCSEALYSTVQYSTARSVKKQLRIPNFEPIKYSYFRIKPIMKLVLYQSESHE